MFHELDGRRVHSVSFGEGPMTLVGIAGSFANWEVWSPVFQRLHHRWRVIGFDHDGVGQTKVPVDGITPERHLETLFGVLDGHGIERCVVVGDSNNASLAVRAVAAQPDRFAGLGVVNGHIAHFDHPGARRFVDAIRTDFEGTIRWFAAMVFPEPDTDHLKGWLIDVIRRTGPEATAAIVEMYFGMDLRDVAAEIEVPALIVHGVLDELAPDVMDHVEEMRSLLDGDLHLIEDAGHLPLWSRPEVVAGHLDDFLTRCRAS